MTEQPIYTAAIPPMLVAKDINSFIAEKMDQLKDNESKKLFDERTKKWLLNADDKSLSDENKIHIDSIAKQVVDELYKLSLFNMACAIASFALFALILYNIVDW